MTIPYPRVLAAIKADSGRQMLACLQGLTPGEIVEVATFIGATRLAAIKRQSIGSVDRSTLATRAPPAYCFAPTADAIPIGALLAETDFQAYADGVSCLDRGVDPGMISHVVSVALADVSRRRKAAALLTIPEDPTGTLPAAPGVVPAALNDADYAASAQRTQVNVAAIKAVARVESGGRSGFDAQGRPKILFEAHHFGPLTANLYDKTHPHLSCKNNKKERTAARKYYAWDQYERLMEAIILDEEAALKAASWGKFQILGEYHDGWPDVRSFVAAMYVSESNHLKAFEAHCGAAGLAALRRKDWLAFARRYNGPAQEGYDTAIEAAYAAAGGR